VHDPNGESHKELWTSINSVGGQKSYAKSFTLVAIIETRSYPEMICYSFANSLHAAQQVCKQE
jgi:hypothetical protein